MSEMKNILDGISSRLNLAKEDIHVPEPQKQNTQKKAHQKNRETVKKKNRPSTNYTTT